MGLAEKWLVAAMLTMILWGLWGVLLKKASLGLKWYEVYIVSNSMIILFLTIITLKYGVPSGGCPSCIVAAVLAGVLGTLGYILMVVSLDSGGRASVVIPLTALYPLVTVITSRIVLGEEITPARALGVALALAAIILLTRE